MTFEVGQRVRIHLSPECPCRHDTAVSFYPWYDGLAGVIHEVTDFWERLAPGHQLVVRLDEVLQTAIGPTTLGVFAACELEPL